MEVPKDLSAENVIFSKEKNILNDIAQETKDSPGYGALTEDELMEKVETILLEKIKEGEKQAYFQLGLFYYEQVWDKIEYDLFHSFQNYFNCLVWFADMPTTALVKRIKERYGNVINIKQWLDDK